MLYNEKYNDWVADTDHTVLCSTATDRRLTFRLARNPNHLIANLPAGIGQDSLERSMNILTFSEARAGLKQAMDDVCRDHEPAVITRQRGEHVVLISLEDFNSMQETLHLLGSPANAKRLSESIAEFNAGKTSRRGLIHEPAAEKEGPQQGRSPKRG
jgi:antitoxin YefM